MRCQDIGYTNSQDIGYTMAKTWVTVMAKTWVTTGVMDRGSDLCISAPGRRAARMPGTGPQRRSSAPARIKALVCKSHFRAALLRSPRRYFFRPICRAPDVVDLEFDASLFGTPPSLFLSTGQANGLLSSWLQKTDQELIPENFKFSRCNGL